MCSRHLQEVGELHRKSRRKKISWEHKKVFTYFDGFTFGVVLSLLPLKGCLYVFWNREKPIWLDCYVMFEVSYEAAQSPMMMIIYQNRNEALTKKGNWFMRGFWAVRGMTERILCNRHRDWATRDREPTSSQPSWSFPCVVISLHFTYLGF